MNPNYTDISFILDRSGSMCSCCEQAIEGFNRFLQDQRKIEGIAKLTLVLFDDEYLVPANALPISEVVELTDKTYTPRNSTALLDAIGKTIVALGKRLSDLPEGDRPGQVIVAILTDGAENASTQFSQRQIAEMIKHQTETYKWTFMFLGANQDAIATASKLAIDAANSSTWMSDGAGSISAQRSLSRKMSAIRKTAMNIDTEKHYFDLSAPLSQIVEEEDRKERQ